MVPELWIVRLDEAGDLRVHAPLLQQCDVVGAVFDQALEQGHIEAEVLGQAVDRGARPQLLVIANEDDVLCPPVQGRHDVGLQDLGGLLDDEDLRPQRLQQRVVLGDGSGRHPDDLHLPKQLELPVPLQGLLALGVALKLAGDLWQLLPGFEVHLQHPLAIGLVLQFALQHPEPLAVVHPVEAPELGLHVLLVLLPVRHPGVLQLDAEVELPRLLRLCRVHVELPVVLLLLRLLLLGVVGDVLRLPVDLLLGVQVGGVVLVPGDAPGALRRRRRELLDVAGLEEGLQHLQPQVVLDLVRVLADSGDLLGIVAQVDQVALPEVLEALVAKNLPCRVYVQGVAVHSVHQAAELLPKLVPALDQATPGLDERPGRLHLHGQLLQVAALHDLAR
mmetsp:Transcript_64226/g.179616  ORF Transcript_64226/g.179616 Transcript_64226/m.179616 type:complete len:390 (+) Transcript_64226:734-1903(+)